MSGGLSLTKQDRKLVIFTSTKQSSQNNLQLAHNGIKKLNDSKRFDITQIHLITTFLLNSIKVTEEFSVFLEKLD
jgi:hypothetical protein